MTHPIPREIKREGSTGLSISWSDGSTSHLSSEQLRKECPCAECKEKRGDTSHAKPLTGKKRSLAIVESAIAEEIDLKEIWGIGQYALGIRWGDGHDSGIYTFEYLKNLVGDH